MCAKVGPYQGLQLIGHLVDSAHQHRDSFPVQRDWLLQAEVDHQRAVLAPSAADLQPV